MSDTKVTITEDTLKKEDGTLVETKYTLDFSLFSYRELEEIEAAVQVAKLSAQEELLNEVFDE